MEKRAQYISRNNELFQEFWFAHPKTLIKINNLFNTSFYGCVLWDLFGDECLRLEKTWNISIRKMAKLPRETHRFFIEPMSESQHIMIKLYKRFLNFIQKVKGSNKPVLVNLLDVTKNDCRSRTGSNLRKILLNTSKNSIDNLFSEDLTKNLYDDLVKNRWKIEVLKELMECRSKGLNLSGYADQEISSLIDAVCTD